MRKTTILVADDMATVRALAKAVLGDAYAYIEAHNGLEAFERARTARPELIVLDVNMPKHDGTAALRLLRADPATATIPVVLMTSANEASRLARLRALGPFAIVDKARLREELSDTVRRLLGST